MSTMEEVAVLLRRHRLGAMADRLLLQEAARDRRSCAERLGEAAQALDDARAQTGFERRAEAARLPVEADLSQVWTSVGRNLPRSALDPFRDGQWVRRHEHVVVVGKSGRGTTYLACALANAVLRAGLRVHYAEVPTLLSEWHAARDEDRLDGFMRSIERVDLLVLDDWGNVDEALGAKDLVALRRMVRPMLQARSVLVVSKHPPEDLGEWLGGRDIADELVGWLGQVAHRFELKGPCVRRAQPLRASAAPTPSPTGVRTECRRPGRMGPQPVHSQLSPLRRPVPPVSAGTARSRRRGGR